MSLFAPLGQRFFYPACLASRRAASRPYADPEKAARRIVEIASTIEPVQEGRVHVEKINAPLLFKDKGTPAKYGDDVRHETLEAAAFYTALCKDSTTLT